MLGGNRRVTGPCLAIVFVLSGCLAPPDISLVRQADADVVYAVADVPIAEVGGTYPLGLVAGGVLHGGGFGVVDAYETSLVLFDSVGNFQSTVGRRGAGPFEFGSITAAVPAPDSTSLLAGIAGRRVVVVGGDGVPREEFTVAPDLFPASGADRPVECCRLVGQADDGRLIYRSRSTQPTEAVAGLWRGEVSVITVAQQPGLDPVPVSLPGTVYQSWDSPRGWAEPHFSPQTLVVATRNGFAYTTSDEQIVSFRDSDGTAGASYEISLQRVPVDDRIRRLSEARIEARIERMGRDVAEGSGYVMAVANRPYADSLQSFTGLLAARTGEVWAIAAWPSYLELPPRAYVFSRESGYLGYVSLPDGETLLAVSRERILTTTQDALGRPLVRLRPLDYQPK